MGFAFFMRTSWIGAVVVAGASGAHGDIVYHRLNIALPTWNLGENHRLASVSIDLNDDGQIDTVFHYSPNGSENGSTTGCANRCPPQVHIQQLIHIDDLAIVPALEPNVPIDPALVQGGGMDVLFATGAISGGPMMEIGLFASMASAPFDNVPEHGLQMFGFSFAEGYGWMRIRSSLNAPTGRHPAGFTQFRLIDLAYLPYGDGGGDILPGQVPAPAAAVLLLGVFAGCRRRP